MYTTIYGGKARKCVRKTEVVKTYPTPQNMYNAFFADCCVLTTSGYYIAQKCMLPKTRSKTF